MLLRLLQGTEAASHGGGDHTMQVLPPAAQTGRERASRYLLLLLNSLPLFALSLFFFSTATRRLWLTGLTSSQLVAVSLCSVLSVSLTHIHPPTSLPHMLPPSPTLRCSAFGGQCQSSAINTPSCLLSSCSLTINEEGGASLGVPCGGDIM